jgi:hypothetical protein
MLLRDFGLWDNIYERVFTIFHFPIIIDGKFTTSYIKTAFVLE